MRLDEDANVDDNDTYGVFHDFSFYLSLLCYFHFCQICPQGVGGGFLFFVAVMGSTDGILLPSSETSIRDILNAVDISWKKKISDSRH